MQKRTSQRSNAIASRGGGLFRWDCFALLHELDYELFAEGVRQFVERLDGRRALWSLKTLVSLRGDVCTPRHLAFLLTPARFEECVRDFDSRGRLDGVKLLVGIGHRLGEDHRVAEI